MTQGINGYSRANYDAWPAQQTPTQAQESSTSKKARDYCTHADSVISGSLCGEDTVVSNACRAGRSDIDQTLCDDKQLHAAQTTVWQATKSVLKDLGSMILGGKR